MEKVILKTLVYADIFDYPLKINEIHEWLIGKKATLRQTEKALGQLSDKGKVIREKHYYFFSKQDGLVRKRRQREKQSAVYFRKARILTSFLKLVPWIKLVGVSGGLAMGNTSKRDDIDLFIITAKNRLWISRLLTLGLLSLTGQRRKVGERGKKIAGKICINTLLEEDRLEQKNKDIFIAHEVLQMKVLWQREGIYAKYLLDNEWVFKFLPNWIGEQYRVSSIKYLGKKQVTPNTKYKILNTWTDLIESLAKKFQLMIMQKPFGQERIQDGALYFHPNDCRLEVLSKYQRKLKTIISP